MKTIRKFVIFIILATACLCGLHRECYDEKTFKSSYKGLLNYEGLKKTYDKEGEFLGEGSFGEVMSVPWGGGLAAVKKLAVTWKNKPALVNELSNLFRLRKLPGILNIFGCEEHSSEVYIATEKLYKDFTRPTVLDKMHKNKGVPFRIAKYLQILRGIKSLHDKNLVHADLKPANIMATTAEINDVKIIDLGMTYPTSDYTHGGTPYYNSPQKVGHIGFAKNNKADDIWSLALIIGVVESSKTKIFNGIHDNCFLKSMDTTCAKTLKTRLENALTAKKFPKEVAQIILKGVSYAVKDRPTADQMIEVFQDHALEEAFDPMNESEFDPNVIESIKVIENLPKDMADKNKEEFNKLKKFAWEKEKLLKEKSPNALLNRKMDVEQSNMLRDEILIQDEEFWEEKKKVEVDVQPNKNQIAKIDLKIKNDNKIQMNAIDRKIEKFENDQRERKENLHKAEENKREKEKELQDYKLKLKAEEQRKKDELAFKELQLKKEEMRKQKEELALKEMELKKKEDERKILAQKQAEIILKQIDDQKLIDKKRKEEQRQTNYIQKNKDYVKSRHNRRFTVIGDEKENKHEPPVYEIDLRKSVDSHKKQLLDVGQKGSAINQLQKGEAPRYIQYPQNKNNQFEGEKEAIKAEDNKLPQIDNQQLGKAKEEGIGKPAELIVRKGIDSEPISTKQRIIRNMVNNDQQIRKTLFKIPMTGNLQNYFKI